MFKLALFKALGEFILFILFIFIILIEWPCHRTLVIVGQVTILNVLNVNLRQLTLFFKVPPFLHINRLDSLDLMIIIIFARYVTKSFW